MEPPGSPSCYYHASQDILGEGRKASKASWCGELNGRFWADYPWDMRLSVVKILRRTSQTTAGTGCSYCNKIKCRTWSFIPPWNWNDPFIFLKPMFTIHLIYPPKYLGVRIWQVFSHPVVGVCQRRSRNHMCKTVLNAQWTRIVRQPLKSSIVFLQLHYHTSFIKEEEYARISKSKTKIKKQAKGTTMKINMVSCYLLTESPVTSNSSSTDSSFSLSPIFLTISQFKECKLKKKSEEKVEEKFKAELWIFLHVLCGLTVIICLNATKKIASVSRVLITCQILY